MKRKLFLVLVLITAGFLFLSNRQNNSHTLPSQASAQTQNSGWATKGANMQRQYSVNYDLPLDNGRLNLKWKRFLGERMEVEMEPLAVGNLVYIGFMNGKMHALNKDNGNTVWVFDALDGITNAPTIATVNGNLMIFFGANNGKIFSLDALNGNLIWEYQTAGPILSTPSFHDNTIFIGSLDNKFYAIDAIGGSLKWSYKTSGPISTTSAVSDEDIFTGQRGIFVASGDNVAYAFSEDGTLQWSKQMEGVFTKRTYAVYGNGVIIFVTKKPGHEYADARDQMPSTLQGSRQNGDVVLEAWRQYYNDYPKRRPLYYYNATSGQDLWNQTSTNFMPLYIPYLGEFAPMISNGYAYFAASGGGGDGGLDHDYRLWKMNLATGEYEHIAHQSEFTLRFDEVGKGVLIGNRFYQTISEDIGYFDMSTKAKNGGVYGNGFGNHRKALEFDEMASNTIFGGLHKFFTRFSCSSTSCFGGGNDAATFIVNGNDAYFTTWGHIYALTSDRVSPIVDYGTLDLLDAPTNAITREQAQQELNNRIISIVNDGTHIEPASRMYSWRTSGGFGSFWHEGEVIYSLAETLPYVNEELKPLLTTYLKKEITTYFFNDYYYQYRRGCIDYDSESVQENCNSLGINQGWFYSNQNLTSEKLYALYLYAKNTGDWATISNNWNFIKGKFSGFEQYWNEQIGYYTFPNWHAGPTKMNLQMAATLGVREMANQVGDTATMTLADSHYQRMRQQRVYWGNYVRNLYDTSQLSRNDYLNSESWGYDQSDPLPAAGYLDKDNEYRQVFKFDDATHAPLFQGYRYDIYPYEAIGYHPVISEISDIYLNNMQDHITDYLNTIEIISPTWFMGDYSHQVILGGHEDESLSITAASDIFLIKAYYLNQSFEELAPYLPWEFEDYDYKDLFRVRHLTALLSAPNSVSTPSSTPTPATCPTDLNGDSLTDLSDYSILANNFFSTSPSNPKADINTDGLVDLTDYSQLAIQFLQVCN